MIPIHDVYNADAVESKVSSLFFERSCAGLEGSLASDCFAISLLAISQVSKEGEADRQLLRDPFEKRL